MLAESFHPLGWAVDMSTSFQSSTALVVIAKLSLALGGLAQDVKTLTRLIGDHGESRVWGVVVLVEEGHCKGEVGESE